MANLAKLSGRLNWPRVMRSVKVRTPRFFLFTDDTRLPDPKDLLARLPRGTVIILRHRDRDVLEELARRTIARAHRLGLKVLLAADLPLALRLGADGVHLSESRAQRGPLRTACKKPGFLITAAAHNTSALRRAARAGADVAMLSPVFMTTSHPGARPLGPIRFARLARNSTIPVIALGGVNAQSAKRLRLTPARGFAAIDAW